jgi:uncharacterized protein YdeI (BOF family)
MAVRFPEVPMRKLTAVGAAVLLACAPALASACDFDTSASTGPAEQVGMAQPAAATKVPAATVAKVSTPRTAKQTVVKEKIATQQSDRTQVVYRN